VVVLDEFVPAPLSGSALPPAPRAGLPELENQQAPETPADEGSARGATNRPPSAGWIHDALAYVPSVARRYLGCGLPFEELLAAGNLGLVEAAIRFDPSRNVKFVTYADWWIRKAILSAIEEQSGPVRLPRYRQEQLRTIHDARALLRLRRGHEPHTEELALMTGFSVAEIARLLSIGRQAVSLDKPPASAGEKPLRELLAAESSTCPTATLLSDDEAGQIRRLVAGLRVRERSVLALRYGLHGSAPLTLREIGQRLGISRERVRQIEQRALLHLRNLLRAQGSGAP